MNRKFHKRAFAAATALLTLSSAVTSVSASNAAARNEITIDASAASVVGGETFDVTVGFLPDSVGASGFTIDLCYDTDAVTLNVPAEGSYAPDSRFALVTNFAYADGAIRIVGADLNAANVDTETVIGKFSFTVKDGYTGDIGFWTNVDTLVAADGTDFYNTEFKAYGEYTQYTIAGPAAVTEPAEEQAPEPAPAPQPAVTEAEPAEEPAVETEPVQLPEEVIPPAEVVIPEEPEEVVVPVETETENETAQPDNAEQPAAETDALFSYTQQGGDYNNETPVQYTFPLSEYSGTVDITVTVSSDGTAQGGIGMQTSEGWKIFSGAAANGGESVWTAENVDISDVYGDAAVQLYYLSGGSTFRVESVKITPADAAEEQVVAEETTEVSEEPSYNEPAAESDDTARTSAPETSQDTDGTAAEQPEQSDAEADNAPADTNTEGDTGAADTAVQDTAPSDTAQAPETDGTAAAPEAAAEPAAETPAAPAAEAPAQSAQPAQTASVPAASTVSTEKQPEAVEKAVSEQSAKADSNPDTGTKSGAPIIIGMAVMVLCAAQMCCSAFKLLRGKK